MSERTSSKNRTLARWGQRSSSAAGSGEPGAPRWRPEEGRLLLTGATGFLGSHLLLDLLEHTAAELTCLSRAASKEAARTALLQRLAWYFPGCELSRYEPRIAVELGDVAAPRLGLSEGVYAELAASHGLILNVAGNVSHAGASEQFFGVNTRGVAELVQLARSGAPKALHHISTTSVIGEFPQGAPLSAFSEARLQEGQSFRDAYDESKYRAEVLLRQAFAEGLAGSVYRVGYVAPHSITGRFQPNIQQNYVSLYVRACTRLGFAPHLPERRIQPTPVDSAARAIITLLTGAGAGGTYYIQTPHTVSHYDIHRVLHAFGYSIRLLSMADFVARAGELSADDEALAAMPGLEPRTVPADSDWSRRELRELGFEYPVPTSAWLARFIRHAIEVGFIQRPPHWELGVPALELAAEGALDERQERGERQAAPEPGALSGAGAQA